MMKVEEFLTLIKKAIDLPSLYVMGGWGYPLNDENKTRTQKNEYNRRAARKKKIYAAEDNVFAWDCVGLTKGILWGWVGDASKKNGGASYASNGVPDYDAKEMMFKGCTDPTTDFSNIEAGEFLWLDGHCGVYLGDGLAAESTPNWADGVQVTAVSNIGAKRGYHSRKWTYHGHLRYVEYVPSKYPATPFDIEILKSGVTGMRDTGYSDGKYLGTIDAGFYTVSKLNNDFGLIEGKGWVYLIDKNIVINPSKSMDGYNVGEKYQVICSEPLNVRTKAEVSDSAKVVTELPKGTRFVAKALTKDSEGNTWMRIEKPASGWVCCIYHHEKYVASVPESYDGYTVGKVYKVTAKGGLRVRLSPSTMAVIKKVLPYGTRVTCLGVEVVGGDTWMSISDGWIAAHYQGKRYVE